MYQVPADHPLYRLFAGVTEQTFYVELGVADPPMIDYLTSMLVRLIHTDAIYAIHNNDGVRLDHLAEMAVEAERDEHQGQRRREIYRHMGDYSLFFVGVFPEALTSRRFRQSKDSLLNFEEQGRRSYYLASTFADSPEQAEQAKVFRRLSHEYDVCVHGLRLVKHHIDHPED